MAVEVRLKELGLTLPEPVTPLAAYVPSVRVGDLIFLSGHGPIKDGKPTVTGKVGKDLTEEEGYHAAKEVALNLLSTLKAEVGDLDKVKRIVKLLGFVNSAVGFTRQPRVINGASDIFEAVFGNKGKHARSALGINELPLNIPVEIELIAQVE